MLSRAFAIIVLLALNGFFVAVEFALVRSRRTRLEAMMRGGDRKARLALKAIANLARMLSASQLGITLSSLGLGWVAESVVGDALEEYFSHALPAAVELSLRVTLGATVALAVVTYLHVVFGELAPRAAALNHPERFARWLAPPLMAFAWIMTPFIWVLNHSSRVVLRMFGERGDMMEEAVHSPEELRLLVEQAQEGGSLEHADAALLEGVFEFSEKNAREVMTPRTDLVALPVDATLDETLAVVDEGRFSRYPVYSETIDDIVGLVLAKDLLRVMRRPPAEFALRDVMRPVHVVPGTREVEEVLADFKGLNEHLAVVLDEFGGTAGIVTMDDLLGEIVGDIPDETDEAERAEFAAVEGGEVLVPGATHVTEFNERFGLDVPEGDYTTMGGYVFAALGRLPSVGDRVSGGGAVFRVQKMSGRRVDELCVDVHTLGDRRGETNTPVVERRGLA